MWYLFFVFVAALVAFGGYLYCCLLQYEETLKNDKKN